ncbi:hypothetical protein ACFL40_03175 [candidate division KSB1 bacterium]
MKKIIFITSGAAVLVVIILLVTAILKLGPIIKIAVNTYGPKITKTEVHLNDVDISILSGKAALKNFTLGNPNGFKSPHAINVHSISVSVDKRSLTEDVIIIDKIEVIHPEITYEKTVGTDNFKAIISNISQSSGKNITSENQSAQNAKNILIKDFIMREGKVNLIMSLLKDIKISAPLPDIHLKNVGSGENGVEPKEAFKLIFAELYRIIKSPDVTKKLKDGLQINGLSIESLDKTKKELENLGKDAKKELETLEENVKKGLESADKTKKELEAAADKLKKLFR